MRRSELGSRRGELTHEPPDVGSCGPCGCVFISAANEYDDRPEAVRDHLVHAQQHWLATLARAAELAVENGDIRPDLEADQRAHDFYAAVLNDRSWSPGGSAARQARGVLREPRREEPLLANAAMRVWSQVHLDGGVDELSRLRALLAAVTGDGPLAITEVTEPAESRSLF